MNDLAVSGLVVRYEGVVAVDGLDLEVASGEAVALLGPSGSGKSSVLRAIAGYLAPRAGSIRIGSRDVTKLSARERNIGMVFQDFALFPHLTVFENCAFGLRARRLPRAEVRSRVEQILDTVGLATMAGRYPRELSGGEQQRVALARAVVIRPTVLLMDEPMGALDTRLRETMQLYVRRLQRQLGITTMYVTHDPAEAYAVADRIVLMRHGKILTAGRTHDVFSEPANSFATRFLTSCSLIEIEAGPGSDPLLDHGLRGHERPLRLARPLRPETRRAFVVIRPNAVQCSRHELPFGSHGVVTARRIGGASFLISIAVGSTSLTAEDATGTLLEGDEINVAWRLEDARVIEESEDGAPVSAPGQGLVVADRGSGASAPRDAIIA